MPKTILLGIVLLLTMAGCASKEEKALAVIDRFMQKTLYDYESYQPVEVKIDSAFSSPYTDPQILASAARLNRAYTAAMESLEEAKEALERAAIWSDSYSTYSRTKYDNLLNESIEYREEAKQAMQSVLEQIEFIHSKAQGVTGEFCGWRVKHVFRCTTQVGDPDIGNFLFIVDPDFQDILFARDTEDEEMSRYRDWIEQAIEHIDSWRKFEI